MLLTESRRRAVVQCPKQENSGDGLKHSLRSWPRLLPINTDRLLGLCGSCAEPSSHYRDYWVPSGSLTCATSVLCQMGSIKPNSRADSQFLKSLEATPRAGSSPIPGTRKPLELGVCRPAGLLTEGDQAEAARFSRNRRGCRAAMRNSASAGPSGLRRPCSQLRNV